MTIVTSAGSFCHQSAIEIIPASIRGGGGYKVHISCYKLRLGTKAMNLLGFSNLKALGNIGAKMEWE